MPASNDRATAAQNTAQATTQIPHTNTCDELSDEAVREFLQLNQDFLQRHPDILDFLQVPHASGSAVSLVEKQVSILRERNMELRHRLTKLTAHARENDKLFEQTRALILQLLEADSIDSLYTRFTESMVQDFDAEHASMFLYGEQADTEICRVETHASVDTQIGSLLKGHKAVCGTLRKQELLFLFPHSFDDNSDVGSAALMPLCGQEPLGLIAVGSSDANRYSSSVGTLFLGHIADVVARLLPRLQQLKN